MELIFTVLLHNITDARMHDIFTPWAPVGAKKQKNKFVTLRHLFFEGVPFDWNGQTDIATSRPPFTRTKIVTS